MKKINAFFESLFIVLAIILSGCESEYKDEESGFSEKDPSSSISIIQNNFTLDYLNISNESMVDKMEILWNDYESRVDNGVTWHEFGVLNLKPISFKEGKITDISYSLLVTFDLNRKPMYYINKMVSYNGEEQKSYFDLEQNNFTGLSLMYNLKGEISVLQYFQKGEVLKSSIDINNDQPVVNLNTARCIEKIAARDCSIPRNCMPSESPDGSCGGSGSWQYLPVGISLTDWWWYRGNIAGYDVYEYSNTSEAPRYDWVWVPDDGSAPSSPTSTSSTNYVRTDPSAGYYTPESPTGEEPTRIFDELVEKEKCVLNLLDSDEKNYVNQLLEKFEGDSEFDIRLVSKNRVFNENGQEVNAKTKAPQNGVITIEFSSSMANNRSVLEVARTLMHELIHADMYRALNTTMPSGQDLDFRDTYNAYNSQVFRASAQHNTMADLYLGQMYNALRAIHQKLLPQDYNYVSQNGTINLRYFYQALAWQGLTNEGVETERWNSMPAGTQETLLEALSEHREALTKTCRDN